MNRELWIGDYQTTPKELLLDALLACVLLPVLVALIVLAVTLQP